jgi:hypothetical protein
MSVKRRKWNFFYSMFDELEETITVEVWLAVQEMMRTEENVQLRHLRTISEHKQSCAVGTLQMTGTATERGKTAVKGPGGTGGGGGGAWGDLLDDSHSQTETKKFFAAEQRKRLHTLEREASLLRTLRCGDFVWGLYHKGCVWYPAIVEAIDIETKEVKLKYLLSTEEVKKYQSLTISRQFLPRSGLNVPQPTGDKKTKKTTTSSSSSTVPPPPSLSLPQSVQNERDLCGFVFDHIVSVCAEILANDENSSLVHGATAASTGAAASSSSSSSVGYVPCQHLIDSLKGQQYRELILTSACLTALFHPTYRLSEHLVTMFSPPPEGSEDDDDQNAGLISRTEFVEYCDIAKDIFVYQIQ